MKFVSWPHHADFVQTPLPIMAMVTFVLGVQLFLMGLLAEMLVRTYHESQAKPIYAVRERLGFPKIVIDSTLCASAYSASLVGSR